MRPMTRFSMAGGEGRRETRSGGSAQAFTRVGVGRGDGEEQDRSGGEDQIVHPGSIARVAPRS